MLVFFDTEFTGLHKNTTLISIGLVTQDNQKLYAELTDYDKSQVDDWIKENVIAKLKLTSYLDENKRLLSQVDNITNVAGEKAFVANCIRNWLEAFNTPVQLVSDVCHYDMVLFIDLFGSAFDLPEFISPVCHDINQDIAQYLGISEKEAFNISREDFAAGDKYIDNTEKHTALFDAEIIKKCYDKLNLKLKLLKPKI